MKLLDKIKKGLIGIWGFLLTIPTKVLAKEVFDKPQLLYGPMEPEPVPVRNSLIDNIWNICRIFIIPIALLIGIIIYFKKAKEGKKKRIILSIGIVVLLILLYFAINEII